MIDKGKYASHGAMIKKLPNVGLAKWQKTKLSVINPIPSTVPRQKKNQYKEKKDDINVNSKTINPVFKFQEKIKFKPVQEDLIKPFLYIEKVMKKLKVQDMDWKNVKPFVTSSQLRPSSAHKASAGNANLIANQSQVPSGYINLYQYQEDKRKTAKKLFTKLMNSDIGNLKEFYLMWNRRIDLQENPQIWVKESEFIEFMKELAHSNVNDKLLKHFFQLYKNKDGFTVKRAVKKSENEDRDNRNGRAVNNVNTGNLSQTNKKPHTPNVMQMGMGMLSIKSLSFNYQKFVKSQVQITNIMSQKAVKQRYTWVKRYLTLFDSSYSELKQGMTAIRQYQQSLRQHFKAMYASYKNPFQSEIQQMKAELQRPIIKYDKHKKDQITTRIEQLQQRNNQNYQRITDEYQRFMDNFQSTIVKNHDLFFNKRIICKLVLPILHKTTQLNKELLVKEIQKEQERKQLYVECLSNLVVEIDNDKKYLAEDSFTLADLVQVVLMKFNKTNSNTRHNKSKLSNNSNYNQDPIVQLGQDFVLKSVKKLIKEIKKQYLLKNELYVQDIQQFPADQEIPMELFHTCFQMECNKVLAKNHIWTQLLNLIPQFGVESKLHHQTITCNQCMGYLKKYFLKLDENSQIERNKSKQVCLLIENAKLDDLWYYNDIVEKVDRKLANFNEDDDEDEEREDEVIELHKPKKVSFMDVAESYIGNANKKITYDEAQDKQNNEKHNPYIHQQNIIANDIFKAIFNEQVSVKNKQKQKDKSSSMSNFGMGVTPRKHNQIPESLSAIKTLSKSFMVHDKDKKLSTNAFDIRFYEKIKQQQQQQEEVVRLGNSVLLSHLPKPQQLQVPHNDPLRISNYLEKSITNYAIEQQRVLQNKTYNSNVRDGVDSNYFKNTIKLENRPTRYDSEGKSKYSVLFPVGYYEGIMANQDEKQNQKWYLRAHHVETLTQNPLSKKDNIINTEYQSKLERIPLKKRPDEFIIEQNVNRKDVLIQSLQERIQSLKSNLERAQTSKKSDGQKVPTKILNKYLTGIAQGKEDKDLQMATHEAVLYDLRRSQKSLLVNFREKRNEVDGEPDDKWWQKKDSGFNVELRKDRMLVADSMRSGSPHKEYVQKLKNKEIY